MGVSIQRGMALFEFFFARPPFPLTAPIVQAHGEAVEPRRDPRLTGADSTTREVQPPFSFWRRSQGRRRAIQWYDLGAEADLFERAPILYLHAQRRVRFEAGA